MMAKTVSVLWANSVPKRCDVLLSKIKANIMYELKMEMCNAPIFCLIEFPLFNII